MDKNVPMGTNSSREIHENEGNYESTIASQEIETNTIDFTATNSNQQTAIISPSCIKDQKSIVCNQDRPSTPFIVFSRPASVVMQTQTLENDNNASISSRINQPQSLFLMTLAKLNESSISLAMANKRQIGSLLNESQKLREATPNLPEPSPPDSLTSAPPSYSFVLRQMTARTRVRPRLIGTFIPSPSFVQHPPPPNYAAAFDIYMDNALPPPTTRVYHFGFTPTPVICTECGYTGMSLVRAKVTICTHMCAFLLCLFCCWICAPLPYVLRSCKDVYHYCRNCRNYLGMYCPTNPDNSYS